jgi:inorganic pyrophosphatase
MTIQQETLLKYNSIDELLDDITTEKSTGIKRVFAEIGSDKNGYSNFKNRYRFFKETIKKDLPELTKDEIIKFNRHYFNYREIYKLNGFDILLKVLEWEELKNKKS